MPAPLNRLTRRWWRTVGREVHLDGAEAWLDAPMSAGARVRDGWLSAEAARIGGTVVEDRPGAGLIAPTWPHSTAQVSGPTTCSPSSATSTSTRRCGGWRCGRAGRRSSGRAASLGVAAVRQALGDLALPMRPLDVARGMDSRVVVIADANGRQHTTGWIRTLRATGEYVYSGPTATAACPAPTATACMWPSRCEAGNVQVFLIPSVGEGGSLWLRSPGDRFGADGANAWWPRSPPPVTRRRPARRSARPSMCTSTTKAYCVPTTSCARGMPRRSPALQART